MPEDFIKLVPFLNRLALFRRLSQGQMERLVENFEPVDLKPGERLFSQGETGDSMYIVVSGRVRITRGPEERERELATFVRGDIFGEEAMLYGQPRSATVTAIDQASLLRLNKGHLTAMLREYPYLRSFLVATVNSRRLARQQRYDWLAKGETIYLITRKHPAFLFISLRWPLAIALIALTILFLYVWAGGMVLVGNLLFATGVFLFVLAVAWGVWIWIDWGNDYYIVTNQRVIWIEKVVGLYDSRNEAPLQTVLTVGTQIDTLGRFLEFGDVIVRTYTGQIVMHRVGQPEQLAAFIQELQDRTRGQVKQAQTAALEREIRTRLGFPEPEPLKREEPPAKTASPARSPSPFSLWLRNIFMVRFEQKGVVTYRKHPILLLDGIWKPTLLILGVLAVMVMSLLNLIPIIPAPFVLALGFIAELALFLWWLYEYVDWRNDIYQLTPDQIIDVYKKPLGLEDKKSANLENILSLQHERKGLLGLLFNYGDVTAMVGGTKFTFDGVYNPAAVEQDIFERINLRKLQQREAEDSREHQRVAEWMAAYHRQVEALRRGENKPNYDGDSG
jgi:hypothetical protein